VGVGGGGGGGGGGGCVVGHDGEYARICAVSEVTLEVWSGLSFFGSKAAERIGRDADSSNPMTMTFGEPSFW